LAQKQDVKTHSSSDSKTSENKQNTKFRGTTN